MYFAFQMSSLSICKGEKKVFEFLLLSCLDEQIGGLQHSSKLLHL